MAPSGLVLEVAQGLARLLLGVESLVKVAYIKPDLGHFLASPVHAGR
jgi:hypothetical protein